MLWELLATDVERIEGIRAVGAVFCFSGCLG